MSVVVYGPPFGGGLPLKLGDTVEFNVDTSVHTALPSRAEDAAARASTIFNFGMHRPVRSNLDQDEKIVKFDMPYKVKEIFITERGAKYSLDFEGFEYTVFYIDGAFYTRDFKGKFDPTLYNNAIKNFKKHWMHPAKLTFKKIGTVKASV